MLILFYYQNPMELVMYLGNDFIASISVNKKQLAVPGYLGMLKRRLMEQNSQQLQEKKEEPDFLVVNMINSPSKKQDQS